MDKRAPDFKVYDAGSPLAEDVISRVQGITVDDRVNGAATATIRLADEKAGGQCDRDLHLRLRPRHADSRHCGSPRQEADLARHPQAEVHLDTSPEQKESGSTRPFDGCLIDFLRAKARVILHGKAVRS